MEFFPESSGVFSWNNVDKSHIRKMIDDKDKAKMHLII